MPRSLAPLALAALALLVAAAAGAAALEWDSFKNVNEVQILTTDADGSSRETTIWLLVLDGQGYIRTSSSTHWGDNVERDPDVVLRIEGSDYPLRASFVKDPALRERILAGFREKYGWVDGMMNVFRGKGQRIMRLDPRS